MANTPNMLLSLPVPSVTAGPAYATQLNTALTLVDSHNHTSGQGVAVPTAGLNINADLSFGSFNATALRTARFTSQSAPLALVADANCLFVSGGNLYYNNGSAQNVQITNGTALSATSLGGISGLAATTGTASFGSATFTWRSNTNVAATMDGGPLVVRDVAASALGITLQSPASLAGAFTLTLPSALPVTNGLMTLSTGGVMSTIGTVTGAALALASTLTMSDKIALANGVTALQVTRSDGSLLLQGNRVAAGTGAADVVINSSVTRTAGLLLDVQNNGVGKFQVGQDGALTIASGVFSVSAAGLCATTTLTVSGGAFTLDGSGNIATTGTLTAGTTTLGGTTATGGSGSYGVLGTSSSPNGGVKGVNTGLGGPGVMASATNSNSARGALNLLPQTNAVAGAGAGCVAGDICWNGAHFLVCINSGVWTTLI